VLLLAGGALAASGTQEGGSQVDSPDRALVRSGPAASSFDPVVPRNNPFGVSEFLQFSIKFGFIKAGIGILKVESIEPVDGYPCHKIVSLAQSNKFFSMFYRVEDTVISHMDVQKRFSRKFEQHLREGKYKADLEVKFDQAAGRALYKDGRSFDIPYGVQDALSALYYVRTLNLKVNDHVLVDNHSNGKNYPLQVKVHRKETIDTPAGRFKCLVVEPFLQSTGLFKQKGRLTVWLTDDERKIPVQMKSEIPVGSITAVLTKMEPGKREGHAGVKIPGS